METLKDVVLGNVKKDETNDTVKNKTTERPNEEYVLQAVISAESKKRPVQNYPTIDVIEFPPVMQSEELDAYIKENGIEPSGFVVWCSYTQQLWYVPTRLCLDQNFIYRDDLEITEISSLEELAELYESTAAVVDLSIITKKCCYILDCPADESYEVYADPSYPIDKYGKATPNGMFVMKYSNRFKRDTAILKLDKKYADKSIKDAKELAVSILSENEAIVISDGSAIKDICTCAHYYIDRDSLIKMSQGFVASNGEMANLVSEIKGVTNALKMCYMNGKKVVRYYYDNVAIVNVFSSRRTEGLKEVAEYKELLNKMYEDGFEVTFIEIHPKTGSDRIDDNKAILFFHNYCDVECRDIANLYTRNYRKFAAADNKSGKKYDEVKGARKPKYTPKAYGSGHSSRPRNNSYNGNNRYGRKV